MSLGLIPEDNIGLSKTFSKFIFFQLDPEENKDQCVVTFWKLYNNSGFTQNYPFTCSISYEDFKKGYYFVGSYPWLTCSNLINSRFNID